MKKTMEQIILEGQVAKCRSLEELYVLWELMQQGQVDWAKVRQDFARLMEFWKSTYCRKEKRDECH